MAYPCCSSDGAEANFPPLRYNCLLLLYFSIALNDKSLIGRSLGRGTRLIRLGYKYRMKYIPFTCPCGNALEINTRRYIRQTRQARQVRHIFLSLVFYHSLLLPDSLTSMTDKTNKTPTKKNTVSISGRIDYELYQWLESKANAEERSIGYYVAKAVEAYRKAELTKDRPS